MTKQIIKLNSESISLDLQIKKYKSRNPIYKNHACPRCLKAHLIKTAPEQKNKIEKTIEDLEMEVEWDKDDITLPLGSPPIHYI